MTPRAGSRAAGPGAEVPAGHRRVTAHLPLAVWLTAVWVGLWGDLTLANLLGGVVVASAVLVLFPLPEVRGRGRLRVRAVVRLVAVFVLDLVKANVVVAGQVLRVTTGRGEPLRQAIVACPLRTQSDRLVTTVANLVSLTPGTLTVEIDRVDSVIYVHGLDVDSPDQLRSDVRDLEHRVIAAFGSPEVLRDVETSSGGPQ